MDLGRPRSPAGESPPNGASRPLVLVVDDDPGVVETYARSLRLEGHDVVTARDAETGLRVAAAAHPDVVLVDLRMAKVDGIAFLKRLRAREAGRQRTPVAIVTGDYFIDEESAREMEALGAAVYFKPLWMEDLVGIVKRLLNQGHWTGRPRYPGM